MEVETAHEGFEEEKNVETGVWVELDMTALYQRSGDQLE